MRDVQRSNMPLKKDIAIDMDILELDTATMTGCCAMLPEALLVWSVSGYREPRKSIQSVESVEQDSSWWLRIYVVGELFLVWTLDLYLAPR